MPTYTKTDSAGNFIEWDSLSIKEESQTATRLEDLGKTMTLGEYAIFAKLDHGQTKIWNGSSFFQH